MILVRRQRFIQVPRQSRDQRDKWKKIHQKLNEQLGVTGKVVSVITYQQQGAGMIHCYGHFIPPANLFAKLNLSTNTAIRYHSLNELKIGKADSFVCLKEFEPRYDDDRFVALINIEGG